MRKTILFTVIAFGMMSFMENALQKDNTLSEKEKKEDWILLFDGTTMNGWRSFKNKESDGWDVKNGELYCKEEGVKKRADLSLPTGSRAVARTSSPRSILPGRDAGRRLLHDRPIAGGRDRAAAGRPAADVVARGSSRHPDSGRLSRTPDDAHRHGRGLGLLRGVHGCDRAPRQGQTGSREGLCLPSDVCDHPYATGLDEAQTSAFLAGSGGLTGAQQAQVPKVGAEPRVRRVFRRP